MKNFLWKCENGRHNLFNESDLSRKAGKAFTHFKVFISTCKYQFLEHVLQTKDQAFSGEEDRRPLGG